MRLLSGNPGMYQHSVEHTTEGETTQHEPEHGEDTIARVKGTQTTQRWLTLTVLIERSVNFTWKPSPLCVGRLGEGSTEKVPVHRRRGRWRQPGSAPGAAVRVRRAWGGAEDRQHIPAASPGGRGEGQGITTNLTDWTVNYVMRPAGLFFIIEFCFFEQVARKAIISNVKITSCPFLVMCILVYPKYLFFLIMNRMPCSGQT